MGAQTDLSDFRSRFRTQFRQHVELKNRAYQIVRDYFGDGTKPGLILYAESLAASLPAGETLRERESELRRAQRVVSSLVLR